MGAEDSAVGELKGPVCVTGASGFIGSHVVRWFLREGYLVRGTVRDASKEEEVAWIKALAEGTPGQLDLFSADLLVPGSFDGVMEGCPFVCHVAAAVKLAAKSPKEEIVDPALEGTKNVFQSIAKAKAAKRVVITSSVAAVYDTKYDADHLFTEEDWNRELTLADAYAMGKTLAEKWAWKFYNDQPEDATWRFELVSVNPALVLGPLLHAKHAGASPGVLKSLLDGSQGMALDFAWSIVHIDDVAHAHVAAVEKEEAKGRYILCNGDPPKMLELATILREKYPSNNKIPTRAMPHWLTYLVAYIHPALTVDVCRKNLGRAVRFNGEKAVKDLGVEYKPIDKAAVSTAESLIEMGLLK